MLQNELKSSSEANSSTKILELTSQTELLRFLECPVCMEVPFPPIFNCRLGHIICTSCKSKLNYCPICKQEFSEARNFTVESIIISSKHSCKYKESGCPLVSTGDLIIQHIPKCPFRDLRALCHLGRRTNCQLHGTPLPLKKYLEHLKEVHMILPSITKSPRIIFDSRVLVDTKDTFWLGDYQSFDSKIFIVRQFLKGSIGYFSLGLIGDEKEARKYLADIKILSSTDKFSKVGWTVPVHSIEKSEEEIMERFCGAVPWKYLQTHSSRMTPSAKNRKEKMSFSVEYFIYLKDLGFATSSTKIPLK